MKSKWTILAILWGMTVVKKPSSEKRTFTEKEYVQTPYSVYSYDHNVQRKVRVGSFYDITVANTGTKPLNDIVIKWTILHKTQGPGNTPAQYTTTEGKQNCTVAILKSTEIVTEIVPLQPEVVGYLIQAYDGDQLLGETIDNPVIRPLIDQARKDAPKNHHK